MVRSKKGLEWRMQNILKIEIDTQPQQLTYTSQVARDWGQGWRKATVQTYAAHRFRRVTAM
jgi:hypothetical protein